MCTPPDTATFDLSLSNFPHVFINPRLFDTNQTVLERAFVGSLLSVGFISLCSGVSQRHHADMGVGVGGIGCQSDGAILQKGAKWVQVKK